MIVEGHGNEPSEWFTLSDNFISWIAEKKSTLDFIYFTWAFQKIFFLLRFQFRSKGYQRETFIEGRQINVSCLSPLRFHPSRIFYALHVCVCVRLIFIHYNPQLSKLSCSVFELKKSGERVWPATREKNTVEQKVLASLFSSLKILKAFSRIFTPSALSRVAYFPQSFYNIILGLSQRKQKRNIYV